MSSPIVFELCAEELAACLAAGPGGADRIEICTHLSVGGVTPHPHLVEAAVRQSGLPVHVLVRPTAETFVVSPAAERAAKAAILQARELGATGVVIGFLLPEMRVAAELTGELVALAGGLEVSFHRAFDEVHDQAEALEALIAAGCSRVLTSGGASNVLAGARPLGRLVEQAAGRIVVAAGGGLTLANAAAVARISGASHFHASMRPKPGGPASLVERIQAMLQLLRAAHAGASGLKGQPCLLP